MDYAVRCRQVAPREANTFDVPPGAEVDAVELQTLLAVFVIKNCAIIFAIAQFPARGALGVLDRDTFGGSCVVVRRLVPDPFVGVWGVVVERIREGKGKSTGADAAVQVMKIDQLIVNGASQRRHRALCQPAVDASVDGREYLINKG